MDNDIYRLALQYLDGGLQGAQLGGFLKRLKADEGLRAEVGMLREVDEAIGEKDVAALRENLGSIISGRDKPMGAFFGLAGEIDKISCLQMEGSEIGRMGDPIQKLHLQNHWRSSKETVHNVYGGEGAENTDTGNMQLPEADGALFEGVREALSEKDIMALRSNLSTISRHMPSHNIPPLEIESYISGDIDGDRVAMLERLARGNSGLASDIGLHREADRAAAEKDIMALRSALGEISRSGASHSRTANEIGRYLEGGLGESQLASFEGELATNPGLARDVALYRGAGEAIREKDIMSLRSALAHVREENGAGGKKVKRGIALPRPQRLAWYVAAASVVLLVGLAGLIKSRRQSTEKAYAQYYMPYNGDGVFRSAPSGAQTLERGAMAHFNNGEYGRALELFRQVLGQDGDNPAINFYSGAVYQEREQYGEAIGSYEKVESHGDNLFVEQARWYMALCYLKRDEKEEALEGLRSIASAGGYYKEKAEGIIAKIE